MLKVIEERIDGLEKAKDILEDHVNQHGYKMETRPRDFIAQQIKIFNREIRIRREYPILKKL